jgi:hypothetical protein
MKDEEGVPMTVSRKALRVVLFVAAAAACVAAALQLREEHAKIASIADDVESQLNALDPATRAAVVARLIGDESQRIKSQAHHVRG